MGLNLRRVRAFAALLGAVGVAGMGGVAAGQGQISAEPPSRVEGDMVIQAPRVETMPSGAETQPVAPVAPVAGGAKPTSSEPGGPSAESLLEDLLKQRGAGAAAGGSSDVGGAAKSGANGAVPEVGVNGLIREGALIKDRTARLKRDEATGATMVVFDTKGPALPEMAAVPSRMLELMENAAGFGDPKNTVDLVFPIDGQVMQYHGKDYLLLNQPASALPRAAGKVAPATMPETVAGVLPQPKIEAVAPGAPAPVRMGDGALIEQRTGRFVKDMRTGAEILVFDGDGKKMQDQPMGLVPCKYLEEMEKETENGTKAVKFRVSGVVTEYRGKDYLYPISVTVIRDIHGGIGG